MTSKCNVEIKAVVHNIKRLHELASKISGTTGTILQQRDIFYNSDSGRLKMRTVEEEGKTGNDQLIFYKRSDEAGPKTSDFIKMDASNGFENLMVFHKILTETNGVRGKVVKKRTLYLVDQTRIHVDEVESLGDFVELEVMLKDGQSPKEGQTIAYDLMKQFEIGENDLLEGAYMDLIEKKNEVPNCDSRSLI